MKEDATKEMYLAKFGQRLKEVREENNLTIKELANSIGLSEGTLSRYENGKMEPKRTTIKVLSEMFSVNPAWLIGYDEASKYSEQSKRCGETTLVPILGTIAAGLPLLAEQNIEGYLCVSGDKKVDFCLRVKGDSMINARIFDGDIVFIRSQPTVENGEVAAVIIDDEATLKRVYKANGTLILRSENPNYKDLVYSGKDKKSICIIGKAVYFTSEVR